MAPVADAREFARLARASTGISAKVWPVSALRVVMPALVLECTESRIPETSGSGLRIQLQKGDRGTRCPMRKASEITVTPDSLQLPGALVIALRGGFDQFPSQPGSPIEERTIV